MTGLIESSRVIADDLRRSERSINLAMRDTAQLLINMLDATEVHGASPSFALSTVKATIATLNSLAESQQQLCVRAHLSAEKLGNQFGLTETSWGEPTPKPAKQNSAQIDLETIETSERITA